MNYKRNCEIREGLDFPENMRRIALGVEYDGACFKGFQRQARGTVTVQSALEKALSLVANENITLVCAGRTDTGVHATNQVIHFDTLALRPQKAWIQGVNSNLPSGARVFWCKDVAAEFHARFSATSRCYRYLIYSAKVPPAIMQSYLSWTRWPLDVSLMHEAAQLIQGQRDFSSFRAAPFQASSPVREIKQISVVARADLIVLEIKANAFLYHMVRNIAGALLEVGARARPVSWMGELLEQRNRNLAPATASAQGLYLVQVEYPEKFALPPFRKGPIFLEN